MQGREVTPSQERNGHSIRRQTGKTHGAASFSEEEGKKDMLEGGETASSLRREGVRKKKRNAALPFLLGAPKNALLYSQKRAPYISYLCFFILCFEDQGGSYTERRGLAVPKAAPRQGVLQDEQVDRNITKNIV